MESGADFVSCDNPHANRLMLHMLAAFAEHEREQILERTKAALAAAKARGVKLGNPLRLEALYMARAVHVARRPAPEVLNIMRSFEGQGFPMVQRNGEGCARFAPEPSGLGVIRSFITRLYKRVGKLYSVPLSEVEHPKK